MLLPPSPLAIPDAAPHPPREHIRRRGSLGLQVPTLDGMAGTVVLDNPRPVEVLHDGRWLHGWLKAYRRDGDAWRGLVDYRDPVSLGHWLQWRPGRELRRPSAGDA